MNKTIKLDGEMCAHCASKIETKIGAMDGVNDVRVNAVTMKFTLDADDEKFDDILASSLKVFNDIEPDCEVLV